MPIPVWSVDIVKIAGGALLTACGFVIRQWSKTNDLQKDIDELKQANLHTRLTTVEQIVSDVRTAVTKLTMLEVIATKQELLMSEVREVKSSLVPRRENEARWEAVERKFGDLDKRIDDLANSL